jgi:hypothetical protein
MPFSAEEFYAGAMRIADPEGRLPLSRMAGWEVFPFDQDGLRVVPLEPPSLPEPARDGEGGNSCRACSPRRPAAWSDDHWRISVLGPSGVPLVMMLQSHEHYDLPDLPDEMASQLGLLTVHLARAIESLPHIARAHVSRWGDGGAHLHVFFFARPAGFPQLRGTCMALWDDLLPPVPDEQRDQDAAAVVAALTATYGGQAAG